MGLLDSRFPVISIRENALGHREFGEDRGVDVDAQARTIRYQE